MKRSNLVFFIEQIVDLSIANQSLCDGRRENETRIKELEEERDMYFQKHVEFAERIEKLESTDHFNAAQTYQKELVKAEKRIKELEQSVEQLEIELQ